MSTSSVTWLQASSHQTCAWPSGGRSLTGIFFVAVAWGPAPFCWRRGAGVEFELECVERLPAGQAEPLGGVSGEAHGRAEEGALTVHQEDGGYVVWDKSDGVYQAPDF